MKKGFTLIELMVTIAIIGLLASIALPRFIGVTDSAKAAQIQGNLTNLRTTIEMFHAKTGEYPEISNPNRLDRVKTNGTVLTDFYSKDKLPKTPAFINSEGKTVKANNKVTYGGMLNGKPTGFTGEGGWLLVTYEGSGYKNNGKGPNPDAGNSQGDPNRDKDKEDNSDNSGDIGFKAPAIGIYANVSRDKTEDPFNQGIDWTDY